VTNRGSQWFSISPSLGWSWSARIGAAMNLSESRSTGAKLSPWSEHWRMVGIEIDRNPQLEGTVEREELCIALIETSRYADAVYTCCNGYPPDVIPLRDLLGAGK
jgi:hypothetical protein